MENKIYKEAILDAKALRASAIANAKSMMQEAIEPAIQEMMRLKLSEELEEEGIEEEIEEGTYEEGYHEEGEIEEYGDEHEMSTKDALKKEEGVDEEVTEATLEEILAELDALEEDSTLNEEEEEEGEDVEDEEAEEAVDDETKVVDITLGDLKAALFPQMGGAEAGEDMEAGDETTPVSLDEILAELEQKEEGMKHTEEGKVEEVDAMTGAKKAALDLFGNISPENTFMLGLATVGLVAAGAMALPKAIPTIKGIWKGLTDKGEKAQLAKAATEVGVDVAGEGESPVVEAGKDHSIKQELAMANETINTLRESINEINLLNAKLLYMNKIFKAKNLTESQKVKVVKAFDRSTSVKEVKNTYEVLRESIETKKSQLKESVGFASKPIGSVAKNNIIEADPFINRWQKIAGIK